MKTIVFLNNKGGVGKTASTTTIVHMMATKFNKKVLLIDLDPQMNSSVMFSEIDFVSIFESVYLGKKDFAEKGIEKLFKDDSADIHDCIVHTSYENLDIIPSCLTLSEAEEAMKAQVVVPQQFKLQNHLAKIKDEYDYCIIDTSPSVSIININGLNAADELYIPLRCDGGSLLGVGIIMNLFNTVKSFNPNLKIGGMFFTQWNGRKNVSKSVYALLEQYFGKYIMPVSISTSKDMEECTLTQEPLLEYSPNSKVTKEYLKLTEYILNHGNETF
ncbi:MAG: ParA family protein [Roseburia faecis]|jgi:chromosome partitioning protein